MKIVVLDGPMAGTEIPFGELPVVIGRSLRESDISLTQDGRVSRRHCRVGGDEGKLWLEDLESGNGTWVQSGRLDGRTPLAEGAPFRVGRSRLCVIRDGDVVGELSAEITIVDDSFSSKNTTTRTLDPDAVQANLDHNTVDMRAVSLAERNEEGQEVTAEHEVSPVEVERLQRRLRALEEVADALVSGLDVSQLFEIVAEAILQTSMAKRVVILLPSDDGELHPVIFRTHGTGSTHDLTISRTIVDQAVRDRMTVLVEDASAQRELAEQDSVIGEAIKSAMCVPMQLDGQVKAVIYLDAALPGAFQDEELELVTAIAKQASVGMQQKGLSEQLQHVSEELKKAKSRQQNMLQAFRSIAGSG